MLHLDFCYFEWYHNFETLEQVKIMQIMIGGQCSPDFTHIETSKLI